MFDAGKAYAVNFPEEIRKDLSERGNYDLKAETVLCPIFKGQCPYGNEGPRMTHGGAKNFEVSVCTSDGLVEKAGLIRFDVEIKVDSNSPNPRKRPF